ncbi:MAG: hypothetical protein CMO01_00455 [Thalassobius sp.]|nr:hypothetical protein [Thalassovita sp.]
MTDICQTIFKIDPIMKPVFLFFAVLFLAFSQQDAKAQLFPTNLEITVLDDKGNIQRGVSVKLYATEDDYDEDENVVASGKTDEKGEIKFKKLDTKPYFIRAVKGDMDNESSANQTGVLEQKKNNKVNVIVSGFGLPKN